MKDCFYNNSSSFKPSIGLANAIRFVNQCRQQWELDQGIWKDTPPCIDFYLKCQTDQMFGEELDHICTHIIILNNSDNSLCLFGKYCKACCFNADIWFAETHCFVWALACSCQQKPEPDGQPAKPFISLQNCYVLQKMAKVHSVHCNAFCFASLQSLSFHLRTDCSKHWLNWTVHCFVFLFARLVMICKVLISLLNISPQDGAAVFFWTKQNNLSNVAVERWTP